MKLICIKNEINVGVFKNKTEKVNLTIGKVYDGCAISADTFPIVDDCEFLIYNDLKKWELYDVDLFEPT